MENYSKLLEYTISSIDIPTNNLTYKDFWAWVANNSKVIDTLKNNADQTPLPKELLLKAQNLFLGFQAFKVCFLEQKIETTMLDKYYSTLSSCLYKYLVATQRKYEGINIYIDDNHLNEIQLKVNSLVASNNKENQRDVFSVKGSRKGVVFTGETRQTSGLLGGSNITPYAITTWSKEAFSF